MAEIKTQEMLQDLATILEQFHQVSQKDYSELCRLSELLAQKEALLEAFAGRERENQRQVKALEDQLNKVRIDYRNDLEKKEHAYQLLDAAKNKAEQEIAKVNTNMAFVVSYQKRLQEIEADLKKKSKELQARENDVSTRETSCQQIERNNKKLMEENGILSNNNAYLTGEIDKVNGLRQQENADFKTKLAAKDKETRELDDKLQGKIREYNELAGKYKAMYQASEAWQKQCANAEAEAEENKDLFNTAEDEKKKLQNDYDTLNSNYTALQAEKEKLENENKKLREQGQQASAPVEEVKPAVNSEPEVVQQVAEAPQPKSEQEKVAATAGEGTDENSHVEKAQPAEKGFNAKEVDDVKKNTSMTINENPREDIKQVRGNMKNDGNKPPTSGGLLNRNE